MSSRFALAVTVLLSACAASERHDPDPGMNFALDLVQLETPDHQKIDLNPNGVIDTREPPTERKGHFHEGVHCVIFTADGKFISVIQDCETVRNLLQAAKG